MSAVAPDLSEKNAPRTRNDMKWDLMIEQAYREKLDKQRPGPPGGRSAGLLLVKDCPRLPLISFPDVLAGFHGVTRILTRCCDNAPVGPRAPQMFSYLKPARTIRAKLKRLVLLSVGTALLIVACLGVLQESSRYIESKHETLLATAQVFSAAASTAVARKDTAAVLRAIRAIARIPGVVYAEVVDLDAEVVAQIGRAVRLSGDLDLSERREASAFEILKSRTIQVSVPVIEEGKHVGRLLLVSDTTDIYARFGAVLLIGLLGAALAVGVGLAISFRLQRSITRPLSTLGEAMAKVEETHDYATKVQVTGDEDVAALASSFNSMIDEIRDATAEIFAREEEVIFRLSRATEQRDGQTGDHIMRMAALCRLTAEGLGLDKEFAAAMHRAAPLHDVGKIAVPDAIMFKTGPLDPDERREMERHTEFGYEILRDSKSELIQLAAEIALTHHERWDGAGYPRGLSGQQIPLSGRIAAVADVCDALASPRAYKAGWNLDDVRTYLIQNRDKLFDRACVDALVQRWVYVRTLYSKAETILTDRDPVAA
jgi:response regulator RpfG family c-di-GMP phosphodiesterase